MKKILSIILLLLLSLLSSIYYLVSGVDAQENQSRPNRDQFSLGIYPPILEINADPPANIEANIHIQNLGEFPISLAPLYRPFEMAESGDGSLRYTNEDLTLIFQKVVLESSLSLEPFESRNLALKIKLDNDVSTRDYYFSVIFISKSSEAQDASAALISGGIGTNVILSIGKKGPSSGEIKEFSVPPILGAGPVPITLLLRNKSSHYVLPTGNIIIKDMLGRQAGQIKILPQYILARSSRFMIDSYQATPSAKLSDHPVLIWPKRFLFGLYTAYAYIKLGEFGPVLESKTSFIVLPFYTIFAASFLAFVLIGIYLRVKRKI